MTKKEYLLKLLEILEGKWPVASGLKLLIDKNVLDDQVIDALQHIFSESIKQITDKQVQSLLTKGQEFLKKLQEKELKEKEEEGDLDLLLEQLLADI